MISTATLTGLMALASLTGRVDVGSPDAGADATLTISSGFAIDTGPQPLYGVPTDGFVILGVTFHDPCFESPPFSGLEVTVTDEDQHPVPGELQVHTALNRIVWNPHAALAPHATYQLRATARNSGLALCGDPVADWETSWWITTGAGPATKEVAPELRGVLHLQPSCNPKWNTFAVTWTADDPYVTYRADDGTRSISASPSGVGDELAFVQEVFHKRTPCVTVTGQHTLNQETGTSTLCADDPKVVVLPPPMCQAAAEPVAPDEAGCTGGPARGGLGWILLALALTLMLRRRRATEG